MSEHDNDTKPERPEREGFDVDSYTDYEQSLMNHRPYHPNRIINQMEPGLYERYLQTLEETGMYVAAADSVCCNVNQVLRYRKDNPEFQELCDVALERFRATFVIEAKRRAVKGVTRSVIGGRNRDKIITTEQHYSDRLLELFLKRNDPSFHTHKTVTVEGGLDLKARFDFSSMSREARKIFRELLMQLKLDAAKKGGDEK